MLRLLIRSRKFEILKVSIVFVLLFSFTGCRELSDRLDPENSSPNEKLQTKKREKPNLSETAKLEVDPDSDELVEEPLTDAESKIDVTNVDSNTNADTFPETNSNVNTNTSANANTNVSDVEKNKESQPIGEKKAKNIVGKWEGKLDGVPLRFEFGTSKKEGDNFVGVTNAFVDNEPESTIKYVIAKDGKVTFIEGKETEKVGVEISSDGNSMKLTGTDGRVLNLKRINSSNKN